MFFFYFDMIKDWAFLRWVQFTCQYEMSIMRYIIHIHTIYIFC